MRLSILDYGVIDEGKTASQALAETVQLAQRAENLNFHRFWVAEHHNVHAFAISSPELVMAHLLNQTKRIRIGSGGIMALHYSAYKLAESIRSLLAFFPQRLDVGFGSSLGTQQVSQALASQHSAENYARVLRKLQAYLIDEGEITANPKSSAVPEMWLLSTGGSTAQLAADLGLGYTFGIFPYLDKNPQREGGLAAQSYEQGFKASPFMPKRQVMLAAFVVLAPTSQEAEQLAQSLDIWMLGKQAFNEFIHFPSYQTAQAYPLTEQDRQAIAQNRQRMVVGNPQEVKEKLDFLIAACQADELLLIPLVPHIDNRLRTLDLLASLYQD